MCNKQCSILTVQEPSPKSPYIAITRENGSTIEIFHKDCLRGIRENVKQGSIDVVVTSPPYNMGIKYNGYNDEMPQDKYLDWLKKVGISIKTALKDDGSFFLNMGE